MRDLRIVFIAVSLVLMPGTIQAAIVEKDLRVRGDGLLTYDEVHQREWLDLSISAEFNTQTITHALSPGQALHGFTLAKTQDVEEFVQEAGLDWTEQYYAPRLIESEAKQFVDLVGVTKRGGCCWELYQYSIGHVLETASALEETPTVIAGRLYVMSLETRYLPGSLDALATPANFGGMFFGPVDYQRPDSGPFWLYRSAVPEPPSMAVFVLGSALLWRLRSIATPPVG